MQEKVDELYLKYLEDKLSLIIDCKHEKGSKAKRTDIYDSFKDISIRIYDDKWYESDDKRIEFFEKISSQLQEKLPSELAEVFKIDPHYPIVPNNESFVLAYNTKRGFYSIIDIDTGKELYGRLYEPPFVDFDRSVVIDEDRYGDQVEYCYTVYSWNIAIACSKRDYVMLRDVAARTNLLCKSGELVFKEWQKGKSCIELFKKYGYVNNNGKFMHYNPDTGGYDRIDPDGTIHPCVPDYGELNVERTLFGYKCQYKKEEPFKLKYQPIKSYGIRYTLCLNKDKLILYDYYGDEYIELGSASDIDYNDNFIFDNGNNKVYLMYEPSMLDITLYYNKHIKGAIEITINSGLTEILSKEEFFYKNAFDIDKQLEEDRKKIRENRRKEEEEFAQKKAEQDLLDAKEAEKKKLEHLEKREKKALDELSRVLMKLSELSKERPITKKIEFEHILEPVGDHLEFAPGIVGALRYIDLTLVSFDNVLMSGIDFSGCNINFDPQKVYNKDLHGSNFTGMYISPFMNFSGVDIRGCRFSIDNDEKTQDVFNLHFKNAIYDETTTYNGVPFTEIIKDFQPFKESVELLSEQVLEVEEKQAVDSNSKDASLDSDKI